MKKVGIITYHSAYNFGSVLQAYATQCIIKKICGSAEIINYRLVEQKKFYSLYRINYGIRTFLKDVMQMPVHQKRKLREQAFESFFSHYMKLSAECNTPDDVFKIWKEYDVIVSGSDQIWNKHSQELEHNSWDFMKPYLLYGFHGKKISYASSVANMTDEELKVILPQIKEFTCISMRESISAAHVSELSGEKIVSVLDPTFLLTKKEWFDKLDLSFVPGDKYILYYSLGGIRPLKENVKILQKLAQKYHCKVKIVTPFAYTPMHDTIIEMHPEMGPIEFLNAIYNAKMIITDSYHGTILSVNFEKNVFSLCGHIGSEFRKTDILKRIDLSERIVSDANDLLKKKYAVIDYTKVNKKLDKFRNQSIDYLEYALT